jgi:hypothetical protein
MNPGGEEQTPKPKGKLLGGSAACIGRESNPGLADIIWSLLGEKKDSGWQRPILPLNHQCCA